MTTGIPSWIKEIVRTDEAPAAVGPYSQATASGPLVFTSGQLGLIPGTKGLVGDSIKEQTTQAMENIAAILDKAGSSLDMVLKVTVYLSNINQFTEFNSTYMEFFKDEPPAREVSEVSRLPLNALVEISAVALRD